jgi:hypothetical protein
MLDRFEAEGIIRALTGGAQPDSGNYIIRTDTGWEFRTPAKPEFEWLGAVAADPAELRNGDLWFNSTVLKIRVRSGGVTYESAAFTAI